MSLAVNECTEMEENTDLLQGSCQDDDRSMNVNGKEENHEGCLAVLHENVDMAVIKDTTSDARSQLDSLIENRIISGQSSVLEVKDDGEESQNRALLSSEHSVLKKKDSENSTGNFTETFEDSSGQGVEATLLEVDETCHSWSGVEKLHTKSTNPDCEALCGSNEFCKKQLPEDENLVSRFPSGTLVDDVNQQKNLEHLLASAEDIYRSLNLCDGIHNLPALENVQFFSADSDNLDQQSVTGDEGIKVTLANSTTVCAKSTSSVNDNMDFEGKICEMKLTSSDKANKDSQEPEYFGEGFSHSAHNEHFYEAGSATNAELQNQIQASYKLSSDQLVPSEKDATAARKSLVNCDGPNLNLENETGCIIDYNTGNGQTIETESSWIHDTKCSQDNYTGSQTYDNGSDQMNGIRSSQTNDTGCSQDKDTGSSQLNETRNGWATDTESSQDKETGCSDENLLHLISNQATEDDYIVSVSVEQNKISSDSDGLNEADKIILGLQHSKLSAVHDSGDLDNLIHASSPGQLSSPDQLNDVHISSSVCEHNQVQAQQLGDQSLCSSSITSTHEDTNSTNSVDVSEKHTGWTLKPSVFSSAAAVLEPSNIDQDHGQEIQASMIQASRPSCQGTSHHSPARFHQASDGISAVEPCSPGSVSDANSEVAVSEPSSQGSSPPLSHHSSPDKLYSGDQSSIHVKRGHSLTSLNSDNGDNRAIMKSQSLLFADHKSILSNQLGAIINGLQPMTGLGQIQEHNRQLLEQLRIRDEEITRLRQMQKFSREMRPQTQFSAESSQEADDLYLPQIKVLEHTIAQQQKEIQAQKERMASQDNMARKTIAALRNELKSRVDQVKKMYEECLKEKDMIVVRFAESEAKNMEAKRIVERSEAKVRDVMRDKETMLIGMKAAMAEKQKALSGLEMKCAEVANLQKEIEKLKDAMNSSEHRIKWFQNKLKGELESHKETKGNLERTVAKLKEAREETEVIRKDCQAIVKTYQESEEVKSNSLDKELKLKETELRTQIQEKSDTEEIHQMVRKELDSLKAQHKDTIEEVKTCKDKIHCLEEENKQNCQIIENYQEIMQRQKSENANLSAKIQSLIAVEDEYKRSQAMVQTLNDNMAELDLSNKELQKEMEACSDRESKMLILQSELSHANAVLRSENTNLHSRTLMLTDEVEKFKLEVRVLEASVKDLSDKCNNERAKRKDEREKMETSLADRVKECNDFRQKWEDEIDNSKTQRRHHGNIVKDLARQLHQAHKRLETFEGKGDNVSMGSRTNSNGSLNSIDSSSRHAASVANQQPKQECPAIIGQVEVDKQVLIERIVRLQKSHARKNEKLEFLGEHIQQLLEEIKRKNRIIQLYALREEAGAMSSEDMDANKAKAQKEMQILLSRKGGIMASLYSAQQQDGTMTLELSLQICRKLQAVLEDTILRNITLKENLDTLGEEIARLSQENRQLQLHLQKIEGHMA